MAISGTIVARKTSSDLLLNEDAARVTCAWDNLRSSDNQQITIEWSAQVLCVDSPADRALLTERFFSASDTREITPVHVSRFLSDELGLTVRRFVGTQDSADLVDGTLDVTVSQLLVEQAKKTAFAAGMAVLPPVTLRIESPSLARQQQLSQVQTRLEAIAQTQSSRAASLTELTRRLAAHDGSAKVLSDLHLNDPLDLYRAASMAESNWASASPALHIATGLGVTSLNPQRPTVASGASKSLSDAGPIRSLRPTRVKGEAALALGCRDGVQLVSAESHRSLRVFKRNAESEFGFNSAGVLEEEQRVLATHSEYGLIGWKFDSDEASLLLPGAARSLVVLSSRVAVFASVHSLGWLRAGKGVEMGLSGTSMIIEIAELPDKLLAIAYADRTIAIVDANAGPSAEPMCRMRMLAPIASICGLDVCGLPRVVAAMTDGTIRAIDPLTCDVVRIGPENYAARTVRGRAGWLALLNADRTKIGLIDLGQPDRLASEIHINAATGNRAADMWFA